MADRLDVSARDIADAANAAGVTDEDGSTSGLQLGASVLLRLAALSMPGEAASNVLLLRQMPFQLEHGETAKANWNGRREPGRPVMETFGPQVTWTLDRLAAGEGMAIDLTIGWGAEGRRYGQTSMPSERTNFLFSNQTLLHNVHPGIARLTNIDVDWIGKLDIPAHRLVSFARSVVGPSFGPTFRGAR